MAYCIPMSNAFDADNTPFGTYGEFDPWLTSEWTDEDWQQYDADIAAELANDAAEREALYWEAEAEVMLAQYDFPDF
jgi:hypothetical protein